LGNPDPSFLVEEEGATTIENTSKQDESE